MTTLTAAAALCTACTAQGDRGPDANRARKNMVRCYDTPQPRQTLPPIPAAPKHSDPQYRQKLAERKRIQAQYKKAASPAPLTLHYNARTGTFRERPAIPKQIMQRLLDSNVRISLGAAYKASGFLTTDKKGRQVVVGPAHLGVLGKPEDFTIETRRGKKTTAASGCYLYEQNGSFADPKVATADGAIPPDIDVAVFRPAHHLDDTPLPLATKPAPRGTWLMLVNSQLDYKPEKPATFSAVTVLKNPTAMGNVAISGLDTNKFDEGGRQAYSLQPGGSGSMMADMRTGTVRGMAVTSSLTPIEDYEAHNLYHLYFNVPTAPDSHIEPIVVGMVDGPMISRAVNANSY